MLEALIGGEGDPKVLARMSRPGCAPRSRCWSEVLSGFFTDHHGGILRMMLDNQTITNPCPGPGGGGFSGQTHLTEAR